MKKINLLKNLFLVGLVVFLLPGCFDDLNTVPTDPDENTPNVVYSDPGAYRKVLAKVYAGLAVSGQQGPAGQGDIGGIDEGFGQYLRGFWYHQELPTDEAVIAWNDQTIQDFHNLSWDANDPFTYAFYSRIFYQISSCNEFLRESTDAKLSERNTPADIVADVKVYRAEARFLRALSYWHALDLFRNVPFITEANEVGGELPTQTNTADLFTYIESELTAVLPDLMEPRSNEYGRVDKAAAWMLLAKLYQNAEIYLGRDESARVIEYTEQVINSGYMLDPIYRNLFAADNHNSPEIIFPVTFDGNNTQTFGGTTFIINAAIGGSMTPLDYGSNGGWGGTRTTSALVNKFPAVATPDGGGFVIVPNVGATYPDSVVGYVIGNHQGFDFNDENARMISVNNDNVYETFVYLNGEGGSFIRVGKEKDISNTFGDSDNDGVLDSGNIFVEEEGVYLLRVDFNENTYTVEKADFGIIGSATPTGWDSDTDMTYLPDEQAFEVEMTLVGGQEIKFRANDAWDLNLGDNDNDGLLEFGGDNILVPSTGAYKIKLYLGVPDYTYSLELTQGDNRALFYTDGQTLEIERVTEFTNGYSVIKFTNVTSDGSMGSNPAHADTDFPMFRLADAYLMYAEAVLRGGGGNRATALQYVNDVRTRAYAGNTSGNITDADLDLDFIINERARELFWECHRRTDLVRFDLLTTGDYLWPWKGGVPDGQAVDNRFNYFPIPNNDLNANPNLEQNPGYN